MTINTDDMVRDFVLNTKVIFEDNMASLGLKEIYTEDVLIVPSYPSIAISCSSIWGTPRTLGSISVRYELVFVGEIWYYHSSVSPDIRKNLVMEHAYRVSNRLIQKASLNNWLVNTRAVFRNCVYIPRLRSGTLLASARITFTAPYQATIATIT